MKGQWEMFNYHQAPTRKRKKKQAPITYAQKVAEYQKSLPAKLPCIPTRTASEEFARAHWHDLHFNGHKVAHYYGVPLTDPRQDPATAAYIIDDTMTPTEEEYYDERALHVRR